MRISISNIAWDIHEDAEVSEILQSHNVDAIDIAPGKYLKKYPSFSKNKILQVRKWWASKGIEIIGMQSLLFGVKDVSLFENKEFRENMFNVLTQVFIIGQLFGARKLVFGSPKNRHKGILNIKEADTIARDFFLRLGDQAALYGVTLCIEPNPVEYGCDYITSSRQAIELVTEIDHPAVKIQLDTGACILNHESIDDIVSGLDSYIGHIHISEPNLVEIGSLKTDHSNISELLQKYSCNEPITIEMLTKKSERLGQINRSISYVSEVYSREGS